MSLSTEAVLRPALVDPLGTEMDALGHDSTKSCCGCSNWSAESAFPSSNGSGGFVRYGKPRET